MRNRLAAAALLPMLCVPMRGEEPGPGAFGTTGDSLLNIPAAAFVPRGSAIAWTYAGAGYIYQTSDFIEPFWAPVDLPTGAVVTGIGLYFDDTDADDDITATLRIYTGGTNNNASFEDVVTASSYQDVGRRYQFADIPGHTVENDTLLGGGMYAIVIEIPATGPALAFKGVDVEWHRQVSPPPGAATFGDVPTDHPFFQFVEALADSGITAGCGNGLYCPDDPLTRGQMAVFLAKALGLHWPN
jgi:hypothetical protein